MLPFVCVCVCVFSTLNRFEQKAEADVARVAGHVKAILEELKRDQGEIGLEYIRLFSRNSHHLRVLRYISVEEEARGFSQSRSSYLQSLLYSENTAENAFVYVITPPSLPGPRLVRLNWGLANR